jgi:hypothetical protein
VRTVQSAADTFTVESTPRSATELTPVPDITGEQRAAVTRLVGRYARDADDRAMLLDMLLPLTKPGIAGGCFIA